MGWPFALEALANNIPVVGMDICASGNSTFKTVIELLGEQGAYYDIPVAVVTYWNRQICDGSTSQNRNGACNLGRILFVKH
ncbi:hypothetical protein [Nostoc sp.]|uniref:hypothetical protein n=1 Tax=Nostoc sp. TaxID=1180 RepID=UPI002FFA8A62